jgi:hypothetical protein
MVEYIKQYVNLVIESNQFPDNLRPMHNPPKGASLLSPVVGCREVAKELARLDPRDFEPDVQSDFVKIRGNINYIAGREDLIRGHLTEQLTDLLLVLNGYRGQGSGGVQRQFPYVADVDLRNIIERDYSELTLKLFPDGAWKSAVIMAGSILEAILLDRLSDPKWSAQAIASPAARDKKGNAIAPDKWTLEYLINIALEIKLLPQDPANTIHQVLRDYRNFVHPKKEIRSAHPCTEAEAMLSVGALDSVCNYLEAHP